MDKALKDFKDVVMIYKLEDMTEEYEDLVSDVDIVAVLLALGDPVTEVTSTDTIINATLTQDDPPLCPRDHHHIRVIRDIIHHRVLDIFLFA